MCQYVHTCTLLLDFSISTYRFTDPKAIKNICINISQLATQLRKYSKLPINVSWPGFKSLHQLKGVTTGLATEEFGEPAWDSLALTETQLIECLNEVLFFNAAINSNNGYIMDITCR